MKDNQLTTQRQFRELVADEKWCERFVVQEGEVQCLIDPATIKKIEGVIWIGLEDKTLTDKELIPSMVDSIKLKKADFIPGKSIDYDTNVVGGKATKEGIFSAGRYRYRHEVISLNQLISAFGIADNSRVIRSIFPNGVNEEYRRQQQWDGFLNRCWQDFSHNHPIGTIRIQYAIMKEGNSEVLRSKKVAPITNLPESMLKPTQVQIQIMNEVTEVPIV